ncbi:MAG: carboxymuconolactone decarboxylase family protein [Betaproteobacteria bacterium]
MKRDIPEPRVKQENEPFIPYVPDAQVVERLRPVVEPYMKRMGFLPNALKLYAHRPEIAETLFRLNSNVMRDPSSTLDQFLKRKLGALASKTNGCAYCTAHSCNMLMRPKGGSEGWGLSQDEMLEILDDGYRPENPMEAACFDYVRAASTNPSQVPEAILQNLKNHLTPPQIVELACVVGFWKLYNTVHDSLHVPVEEHLLDDTRYVDA